MYDCGQDHSLLSLFLFLFLSLPLSLSLSLSFSPFPFLPTLPGGLLCDTKRRKGLFHGEEFKPPEEEDAYVHI
jgi:hypothetical protein